MDEWMDGWRENLVRGEKSAVNSIELDRTRRGLNEDQIIEIIYS